MTNTVTLLAPHLIQSPPSPMRSEFDADTVQELAQSIKEHGLINPITVRPVGNFYEVVAGHRRFKACRLIGLQEIPAIVRELTDDQVAEVMAAENLERADVDPVDEALFIGRLLNIGDASIESVAKRLNRSRTWVEERLDILNYPDYLVIPLKQGTIKLGVAKWLGRIESDIYRKMYSDSAVKNGMSVLQAEYAYRQSIMGLMPDIDALIPPPSELSAAERPKARALCARCERTAVEPNLRMVWVHINCEEAFTPPPREILPPVTQSPSPS